MNMRSVPFCLASFILIMISGISSEAKASDVLFQNMPAKFGYVDFHRAVNEVSDGKRAKQRLSDSFRDKQREIERIQTELSSARESLDRDRILTSPEALAQREEKYKQRVSNLQQKYDIYKREIAGKENALTQDIVAKLHSIVKEIGKEEGYALILEKSQEVVLFSPDGNDLTERVIALYDGVRRGGKK